MPGSRHPSHEAGRVLRLGVGPTVLTAWLPAVLVELGLAQRHPSVTETSLLRDSSHRAPLPTCGDRPNQRHEMTMMKIVSYLDSEGQAG